MHPNHALIERLFAALAEHDHEAMAACYTADARFRDIAFNRRGRDEIRDMWLMICSADTDIRVKTAEVLQADDRKGSARLVETYSFEVSERRPRVPVRNEIISHFVFDDGRIKRQDDDCDPRAWAKQALGDGPRGFLAGRIRLLRSVVAWWKLHKFLREHRR